MQKEEEDHNEDLDKDFYDNFEIALENDEITAEEEAFMRGFSEDSEGFY